jgi:hypothetical protein
MSSKSRDIRIGDDTCRPNRASLGIYTKVIFCFHINDQKAKKKVKREEKEKR